MKRWMIALTAVAFLAGGPALAGGETKCSAAKKQICSSQQAQATSCAQAQKATCAQAQKAGCDQAQKAACIKVTRASCGQALPAGCSQAKMSACGQATMVCGGVKTTCGSMPCGGSCGGRVMHVSHDPANIWFRGPAPRATVADWAACCPGGKQQMACGGMHCCGKPTCRAAKMSCGQAGAKGCPSSACDAACPQVRARTAWKSGCGAGAAAPKRARCAGPARKGC